MIKKLSIYFIFLSLFILSLLWGEISLDELMREDLFHDVVLNLRLSRTLTAIAAGGSLAVCGLLLQSFFQNPLAGPFVLGIHAGAMILVALWIFVFSSTGLALALSSVWIGSSAIVIVSVLGSLLTFSFLYLLSFYLFDKTALLITGLLLGFFASGILSIFTVSSDAHSLQLFYLWTLGSFEQNSLVQSCGLIIFSVVLLFIVVKTTGRLNLLLLGPLYAQSMGLDIRKFEKKVIAMASLLVGAIISFCGPIAFVGMMSPHIARYFLNSSDHHVILVPTFLIGAIIAMTAQIVTNLGSLFIPINAGLSLLGVPFFIVVLLFSNSSQRKRSGV